MKKSILFLTHENPQGYRIQDYFPYLHERGFETRLLTSKAGFFTILDAMRSSSVVYIQRLLFAPLKLGLIRKAAKRIIYDFDDAVMYGRKGESASRQRKFRNMVTAADAVFCGNRFLLAEACKYKTSGTYYVPTVVDISEYPLKKHRPGKPVNVGWIGSSSTLTYLADIDAVFSDPLLAGNTVFTVIADRPYETPHATVRFERWKKEKEKTSLLGFDIGIMPLRDDLWSRGKCGLKLIQYMAAGIPAVAHPVGAAGEIVEDGINGYLRDTGDWCRAIETLGEDAELRCRIGSAARANIEKNYSLQVWGPRVAGIIESL